MDKNQTNKLRNNFECIIQLKYDIVQSIHCVRDKLLQLKTKYNEMVKTNSKKIFLFCFDSFFSQYKTFIIELEHFENSKSLLNNRMYCDYFKLYNIIITYCKENKNDFCISNELINKVTPFTIYKDLEPIFEYDINEIIDIHSDILLLVDELESAHSQKNELMTDYINNHKIGFTISNFINTLSYENTLMKQQISLFLNFVSFFQISQKKQLSMLLYKLTCFHNEVIDNLDNNQTFSIEDIVHKEPVTNEILEPVTNEILEPVTNEILEPVTTEILEPVTNEILEPVTNEILEPVTTEILEPVTTEILEPVTNEILEPVTNEILEPVTNEILEPVTNEILEPIKRIEEQEIPIIEPIDE
jgi:hypothetical protein